MISRARGEIGARLGELDDDSTSVPEALARAEEHHAAAVQREVKSAQHFLLRAGLKISGPALIEEYGSSTLIGPRDTFTVGKLKEIDIDCSH